jgi:hypothetical protein
MKLKLILTFDHELPLGGVRTSYQEALFEPTKRLFNLAEKLEVPVVLFTDVLCALKFKEWDEEHFYKPYTEQLQEAVKRGHDVQLHLHPHWLTSRFENNTFIPSKDYKIADFASNPTFSIETIIEMGIEFLRLECAQAQSNYTCNAFRAGGYNIESETARIFSSLYKHGIRYDSSIIKGYYFRSALSEVNCQHMPSAPNWYIGTDGNIRKEAPAGILEVPIGSIPKTPFEVPTRFKLKKMASQAPQDHGYQIHEGNPTDFMSKVRMLFSARMLSFDNYTLSLEYLMKILDYNVRKYSRNDLVILSVSGHPKSMGDYSFQLMESFITRVRQKYPDVEFTSFSRLDQ